MLYAIYKLAMTALPALALVVSAGPTVASEQTAPAEGQRAVLVKVLSDGQSADSAPGKVVAFRTAPADPNAGWLGVSLDEVNPALKAQLGLDDEGVMISNVVGGSPAEAAGLQRFDVVLAIDGKGVEGSVTGLAEMIAKAGVNAQVQLDVLRSGKQISIHAKLGQRPAGEPGQWLHEFAPDGSINHQMNTRGRVLMRGEDGEFEMFDLGELDELKDLPDAVKALMPHFHNVQSQVFVDGQDGHNFKIKSVTESDGVRIEIEQADGSDIVVRRTQMPDNGEEVTTENAYADAEALKSADPEAYEMYSNIVVGRDHDLGFDFNFSFGNPGMMKTFKLDLDGLSADLNGNMEDLHKALQESLKNIDIGDIRFQAHAPGVGAFFGHQGKAKRSFTVNPDGTIELRLRKGESEIITKYNDADDLAERNPDAYNEYADVLNAEVLD